MENNAMNPAVQAGVQTEAPTATPDPLAPLLDDGKDNSKKARISKAQEYMFFAVLGAALVLGVTVVVAIFFVRYIAFNARVISAKDEAILAYSSAIKNSGACPKPKSPNGIYTEQELNACSPNDVAPESVPGSLRSNVLLGMISNVDLESVARQSVAICYDKDSQPYTYEGLEEKYENATTTQQREYYLGLIKMCSSLRVIPDALPSVNNENALMSSLGQLFRMSDWEPESLTPSNSYVNSGVPGVNAKSLSLSVEGNTATTMRVLANIEKSIRNFEISSANIEWGGNNLTVNAQATAYYTDGSSLKETNVTVDPEGDKGSKK